MDDNYRWYLLGLKRHEIKIRQSFERFRDRGIEPILIKGWVSAKLYPWGIPRFFVDTDLAVARSDYENAFRFCEESDIHALGIDLHNELRHLDTESWDMLFHRSQLVELDGTEIRVLCPEDHLRIICVHWLNDGGAYKERLWDIVYAVRNRPAGFDWDLCLGSVSDIRRRWIICSIGLGHKYLDLEIDDLPFAGEARKIPAWVTRTVEKEWESPVRLRPLHSCLRDRKILIEQIKKRLHPNPIQSAIDMEGSFDTGSIIYYQIGSTIKRSIPSAKRIFTTLYNQIGADEPDIKK